MRDEQVTEVLNSLNKLWPNSKHPLDKETRVVWGALLSKHDHGAVLRAVMGLVQTSKWRPVLAEILDHVKEQDQRRRLAESKRQAIAPAPDGPVVPPERVKALVAPIMESTRPTRLENMVRQEPTSAVGNVGERRRWGALALQVLCERIMARGTARESNAAEDVLDEVARRATGGGG